MEHAESINFEIINRLKKAKIDFAFPTQSLQLSLNSNVNLANEKVEIKGLKSE